MLLLAAVLIIQQGGAQLPYQVPQGWSRSVNPSNGLVSLWPPRLGFGRLVVLTVFNPEAFSGSALDYHNEIVRRAASNARQLEPAQHGSVGGFMVTALHQVMPSGAVWARIYTARWGEQGQTFILSANMADGAAKFAPAADSMMAHVVVPSASVAAVAPAPPQTQRPPRAGQIDGVYLTLKNKGGFNAGVSKDYMVFFPDGQVFWHLPEEGLLDFDLARSHREWNDFWGRYEMQGERVHVAFNTGPSYDGRRNADGTLALGSYTYVRQTAGADGRTLSGTYRAYNLGQDPSRDVTFYPDGRFDDRGIRGAVGALDLAYGRAKVATDPGSGRYRIARYSIVFEYSDGRKEQLSFYIPGDDGSNIPRQLVINTFNVVRVSP
jgi:hypothetical protein